MLSDAAFIGFIPVRNPVSARAFYAGTLGLSVVEDTAFALVVDAGGTLLRVTPVPDIEATVRALSASGVRFERYDGMAQDELGVWTSPSGDRVAWFKDPDGNTLSVTALDDP